VNHKQTENQNISTEAEVKPPDISLQSSIKHLKKK
jgi:hypothetical protein